MPLDMFLVQLSLLQACVYCYVVYVDGDISFINEVTKYGVHHHLKGGWRVTEAKEHHSQFIESFISNEHHFSSILFFNEDFVVSPFDIKPYEEGISLESIN